MSYEQLDTLRSIFLSVEAERERLRWNSLVRRFRKATAALRKTRTQPWHEESQPKAEKNGKRGDRVRALCSLLMRSDNPEVMEALATQLREAINEYARSTKQVRVLSRPSPDAEFDRRPSLKPAA